MLWINLLFSAILCSWTIVWGGCLSLYSGAFYLQRCLNDRIALLLGLLTSSKLRLKCRPESGRTWEGVFLPWFKHLRIVNDGHGILAVVTMPLPNDGSLREAGEVLDMQLSFSSYVWALVVGAVGMEMPPVVSLKFAVCRKVWCAVLCSCNGWLVITIWSLCTVCQFVYNMVWFFVSN